MELFEELKSLGVDVDDGLKRIMGNEKLYTRLLGVFVKTMNENIVDPDFDTADCKETIERVHTIKGTAGNLSLTPIYEAYAEALNLLRSEKAEEAKTVLEGVLPVQKQILECIEKYMQ